MSNDPISDFVTALDLAGGVFLEAEFSAPWAITAHVTEDDCRPFMPPPKQVIAYHVITEGEVSVSLDGDAGYRETYRAKAGDIVFLPTNVIHVLASENGLTPVCGDDLLLPAGPDGLVRIRHHGGGGARTRMLCGFIASNAGPTPLLNTLPELLVIGVDDLATLRWIEASIVLAARELLAGRLAKGALAARLAELLLVEALRAHLERAPRPNGWLMGLSDARIARALARIHADLASPPSVTELAATAGVSRSAFVDKFTETMGVGPRRYILDQRMDAARLLLRDTALSVAEIAYRVGYEAPEAFSRAFKRETGQAPADLRMRSAA